MAKMRKFLLVALSTIFVLSLVSPLCCHANWTELFSHAHQHSAHHDGHNDRSNSGCDNHLVKNLSKPDQLFADVKQSVLAAVILPVTTVWKQIPNIPQKRLFRLIFFNKAGPPIYLLNSVFLN